MCVGGLGEVKAEALPSGSICPSLGGTLVLLMSHLMAKQEREKERKSEWNWKKGGPLWLQRELVTKGGESYFILTGGRNE